MSTTSKPRGVVAPVGLVKGGSTTARFDRSVLREEQRAERARDGERSRRAAQGVYQTPKGMVHSSLAEHSTMSRETPRVVLNFLNRDKTIRQQCICEVLAAPAPDGSVSLSVTMVCPRCVARGIPQGQAQLIIRDTHRKFWIDDKRKGQIEEVISPGEATEFIVICGTMTAKDRIRCAHHNCDFACRIDASNVFED